MRRGKGRFAVGERLLVELLAWTKAAVLDADIALRQTRKTDQLAREIGDLHRFAHVEDENLAAAAHHRRLHHELRRFRNRHEITLHVRVRDGQWTAARDLLAKARDDAARGAEHVTEAHDDELGGP